MRNPYLGKIALSLCDVCHVPVPGPRYACVSGTWNVAVTPPGDIRPAFPCDIDRIDEIYLAHFGAPLVPPGDFVLMNNILNKNRMDETIVSSAVVGAPHLPEDLDETRGNLACKARIPRRMDHSEEWRKLHA
jgi:phosphoadenosine phosphosulfate reductase